MGDTDHNDNPGDLRNQLEQANTTNKDLAAQVAQYQQDELLRDSGFGHLSKRQRRTILRDLADEGKDFSPEAAKEIAEEHGYPLTPPATTTTTTTGGDEGQGNGQGDGQGEGQPNNQDPNQPDDVNDSLTAMDLMDRARKAAAGNAPTSDFETEIGKTNSKEELTSLIRNKGARHGIVHEWDVP